MVKVIYSISYVEFVCEDYIFVMGFDDEEIDKWYFVKIFMWYMYLVFLLIKFDNRFRFVVFWKNLGK